MIKSVAKCLVLGGLPSTATAVSLPPPTGQFNTTITKAQLIDHSRLDPYAPSPQPRSLMISIFQPSTCTTSPTPYMDSLTAAFEDSQYGQFGIPAGTFGSLALQACSPNPSKSPPSKPSKSPYPVILFSPGLGNTRLLYSAISQQVSSTGYTVITIDHPYDADIVAFPDGRTISAANISTDAQILQDLQVRVRDVSFVLDQLSRPSVAKSLFPNQSPCGINLQKVGIFGHSLGGATAAQAMLVDPRLAGGINLDGTFFRSVIKKGLKKPFLIFAHEGKNTTTDASWGALWPKLRGWKRELVLEGGAHGSFTDLADLVDVLGFSGQLSSEVGELLGTIEGARALEVVSAYVVDFFDFVLKGKKVSLLDGPNKKFPELLFGHP
jgi:pimeloyl-ACP methyl ester carboxylesterase